MKTYAELIQDSKKISIEIDNLNKFFTEDARARYIAITGGRIFKNSLTDEQKNALEQLLQEEKEKTDRYNLLKVTQRVLFDNIRLAYYAETMPKVLEVLKKYHNKPYGPGLKKTIQDDLKRIGVFMYISSEPDYRSDEMHILPVNNYHLFGNDDMTIITRFIVDGSGREKLPMIGGKTGNRLLVYNSDNYMLQNCKNYAEDPEKVAAELIQKYKKVKEQFDKMESDLRELNDNLPSRIDWIDANKLHFDSLASHLA